MQTLFIVSDSVLDGRAWQVEDIEALVTDVQDHVFGEMRLPPAIVTEVQQPG